MKCIISVCSSWQCAYIHEEEWPCVLGLPVRHSTNHLRGIREYTRSERGMFLYTYRCPGSNHDMPMFSVVCHLSRHLVSGHILFHVVSPSQLWSASIASAAICNIVFIESSLSDLCTCPIHLDLFSLRKFSFCVSFQMSTFVTWSNLFFHRNMRISVGCNFLFFFLTVWHSAPYVMAGFIADL